MTSYNGWIEVFLDREHEGNYQLEKKVFAEIEREIAKNAEDAMVVGIQYISVTPRVYLHSAGKRDAHWPWIKDLFQLVARIAPGSYGLLHVWNPDDLGGLDNEIQTWVVKRGIFVREKDTHLSPYFPTVED